jgi:hypothetical protein
MDLYLTLLILLLIVNTPIMDDPGQRNRYSDWLRAERPTGRIGLRIFTSLYQFHRIWGSPNLMYNGKRGLFPGGKAAGA